MLKKGLFYFLIGLALLVVAACSGGDSESGDAAESSGDTNDSGETISIQAAHVVSTETTQHEAFLEFKDLVEERSDGRIEVEIYPDGQLGGEREMIESTQAGNIQMSSPSVGVLANFSSALEVFDFPFIFKDTETAHEVLDGEFGQELLTGLEENGFVGLSYGELGWRHLSNNQGEVVTPEDAEGVKLRTMEVPMHIAYWESVGLNPTPLAFTEVFNGLQQGVVDGVENTLGLIYTGKFHEVSKYITMTEHIYDPEVYIMNQDFFNGLSEEDQEIIQSSIDDTVTHLRELNSERKDELITMLEDEGAEFRELSEEEKQVWVDSAIPFYEEYADEVDKEKLIKLLEAAGNETYLDAIE
ncbi:tripartite ATP-independent transporter solute receptor, DctP family [Lentibacillus persicus]|uniref:Tripartite ATP-independent transporter solute receptor, DctP family n=1 Tax=Lentibacillus persicus TaxID=640948 RepID=A0A1I1S3J3_9BACI|nr:TRAP transporter substrate-binding protein [Lentibacillus persicus]SFD40947.1 tripartite ATP-independent transporter solute receptor, DctP family [Lentibacillus persicus]